MTNWIKLNLPGMVLYIENIKHIELHNLEFHLFETFLKEWGFEFPDIEGLPGFQARHRKWNLLLCYATCKGGVELWHESGNPLPKKFIEALIALNEGRVPDFIS